MNFGDIRNGLKVLPKGERKTILLLSDDLRSMSGIATMSREFVLGLAHHYNFIQLAALIEHPDLGRVFDLSQSIEEQEGIPEPYVKLYPYNGYGDPGIIRQLIQIEEIDIILHFTDPRYWLWLYEMEHELRRKIPIAYYTIWDNLPDPKYNRTFYESCDLLMCISKQTYGIVKRLTSGIKKSWQVTYVPHGVNPNVFKPIDRSSKEYQEYYNSLFDKWKPDFLIGFNSRNIGRKNIMDIIYAYSKFCGKLPKEQRDKVGLILHTQPVDPNGTDLPVFIQDNFENINIMFSQGNLSQEELNMFYNTLDCTISASSNEGFGITKAESVMAGTPIIVNVTGGLQDHCGFKLAEGNYSEGEYIEADDYIVIGSLHDKQGLKYLQYGPWVKPVWPKSINLKGAVPTPYIFDDQPDIEGIVDAFMYWYNTNKEDRTKAALEGRRAFIEDINLDSSSMCRLMGESLNRCLDEFEPRKNFSIFKV